ncbi:MAG: ATP-binding protein [Candidatus Woesearchaeota archaeon]|nr:ATP-binding protein [Candidatus Woesearchaeota archaeon]
MIRFIDRIDETRVLEKDWNSQENAFIVVFGRRRIGKTRLLDNFLQNKDGARYTAEDTNKRIQINEFKSILASYLHDDFLLKQDILDWGSLFSYLSKVLDKKKRIYIWIDEFSYLIKNDHSITSVLQKFIDDFIRNSNVFFIVSGSIYGLMSQEVLSHSSPLYGRRTRDLLLKPIPARYCMEFLPFDFEDSIKTICTLNGIPEYLNVASKHKSYEEFILNEFFKPEGYFYREPFYLLSQEFKEIRTYFSILNAIAYGNSKPTEIANFVGINAREIYPYLELLIGYGFVARETSILGDRKKGVYYISDNFFDFWFNFVHKNRENIERGYYKLIKKDLNDYFGRRFEVFVRENFLSFFRGYEHSGRWWWKDKEIDVVALNEQTKEILFAECKWKDDVNVHDVFKELNEKAKYADWNGENRKESFAVFAKSFKKKINEFEGKKVHCFDLKDIEKSLKK